MNRLTPEQRFIIVETYYKNHSSVKECYRALQHHFGRDERPSERTIRNTINKLRTNFTLLDMDEDGVEVTIAASDEEKDDDKLENDDLIKAKVEPVTSTKASTSKAAAATTKKPAASKPKTLTKSKK